MGYKLIIIETEDEHCDPDMCGDLQENIERLKKENAYLRKRVEQLQSVNSDSMDGYLTHFYSQLYF